MVDDLRAMEDNLRAMEDDLEVMGEGLRLMLGLMEDDLGAMEDDLEVMGEDLRLILGLMEDTDQGGGGLDIAISNMDCNQLQLGLFKQIATGQRSLFKQGPHECP